MASCYPSAVARASSESRLCCVSTQSSSVFGVSHVYLEERRFDIPKVCRPVRYAHAQLPEGAKEVQGSQRWKHARARHQVCGWQASEARCVAGAG
eukprot:2418207-Pleurochrysis_carterae.AAC.3